MENKIPVIFCIDAEPDLQHLSRGERSPWFGYETAQKYFSDLRPVLESATGSPVHYNWFLRIDDQMGDVYGSVDWVVHQYREQIHECANLGDEIGIHLHLYQWVPESNEWVIDLNDQETMDRMITTALEAYARDFSKPCRSFRFGNNWINGACVEVMDRLGVHYDLTLVPCQRRMLVPNVGARPRGIFPSFQDIPRIPYHPSRTNFHKANSDGSGGITMIPLTVAETKSRYSVRSLVKSGIAFLGSNMQYARSEVLLCPSSSFRPPDTFSDLLSRALLAQEHPYIALAVRSDFAARPEVFARVKAGLESFLNHPLHARFVFTTPAEAMTLLRDPL